MPRLTCESKTRNGHSGETEIVEAALKYYDLGLWIVPAKGKQLIRKDWPKKRRSREELARTLRSDKKFGIAFVLNHSDWIDVECDSPESEVQFREMCGGDIPTTATWQSKRGKHFLFRRPDGLPESAVEHIDAVEFRIGNSKGASSTLPPSVIDGVKREWLPGLSIHECDPVKLPEPVAELLQMQKSGQNSKPVDGSISEGQRNEELFKLACKQHDAGMTNEMITRSLLAENVARCSPPLPESEVQDISSSACSQGPKTAAQVLLAIVKKDCELWHSDNELGCVTIHHDGHTEHWRIRSKQFKSWLARQFYEARGTGVASQTMQDCLSVLDGQARFDGDYHSMPVRVAEHDGSIYIDMADAQWRAIEVDQTGWRIVESPPVRFRRPTAMLAMPEPKHGGSLNELRMFINVSDSDWPLLAAWIVAALRPSGPFPVLKLAAEQGSGKSTATRYIRSFIDPNSAGVRSAPRKERDLMIAAINGWLLAFDNLSHVSTDLSDALCRLATGGGFATRTLYENDEETVFNAMRPVIMNSIEEVGIRSDLLDRSLVIELPRIDAKDRKTEKTLDREFAEAWPRILGAILDAVSCAIRNLPDVEKLNIEWPRMADFAMAAVAAEEALDMKPGTFLECYKSNIAAANEIALEASPVVIALMQYMKKQGPTFDGTATQLLDKLSIGQDTRCTTGWPGNAKVLSGILKRLKPNLRKIGIEVTQTRHKNSKVWQIKDTRAVSTQRSQSPQHSKAELSFGDKLVASRKKRKERGTKPG
ncbi:MAG: bifunctional DNA primase/polymerase [Planctomycetales bacterium]